MSGTEHTTAVGLGPALRALIPVVAMERERWPAFVLDHAGAIVHVNSAWDREARRAGGPLAAAVLASPLLSHIAGEELRAWHGRLLQRLLHGPVRAHGGSVQVCDCNTAERYRIFATRFLPLSPTPGQVAGVLVLTELLEEGPVEDRYGRVPFDEQRFRTESGVFVQCSGCRRLRVAQGGPPVWSFVPELVARPRERTSHSICERCRRIYYEPLLSGIE